MRINAEDTVAIVVDFQEKLVQAMEDNDSVISKAEVLIKGLNEIGVPCIVSQQYTKGLGPTVPPIAQALGNFNPIEKTEFSCYQNAELKSAIEGCGKKTALICGVEAHICVLQTIIDMKAAGYNVVMVQDCVASRSNKDKDIAVKRASQEGAFITTCEAVLFELIKGSSSPHFKTISKLVK